jgi:putative nucleotidyltransferase with HDIG domain
MALPLAAWGEGPLGESVIDPFQGRADLAQKCIRSLNSHVFQDDPGRLLRTVRLAVTLGFRMEPETVRQVLAGASLVERVSPERLREEFMAILSADGAKGSLEALDRLDLLCRIIPELELTKGVDQPKVHYWDVWGHLLHTVENAERITKGHQHSPVFTLIYWTPETDAYFSQEAGDGYSRRAMLKLAALFHDIAKPQTKQKDETGRTRFPQHSELGAAMTTNRLRQLRFQSQVIAMVSKMVEQHLRPAHMMQGVPMPTGRAIYRYFRDVGNVAVDTLYLCQADFLAARGPELSPDDWADHARMIAHVVHTGLNPATSNLQPRLINGNELMDHFNLDPGPKIGQLLEYIEEARAAGEISSREEALALASQTLAQYRGDA